MYAIPYNYKRPIFNLVSLFIFSHQIFNHNFFIKVNIANNLNHIACVNKFYIIFGCLYNDTHSIFTRFN